MHILDTSELTTAQHCTGIMRLENVLKNDREMPCAKIENFLKTLPAFVGDELREKLKHGYVTSCILLKFKILRCKNTKKEKITKKRLRVCRKSVLLHAKF